MFRSIFTILLFALISPLISQDDVPVWKKLRYLSEEEMYMEVRTSRDFIETDPPEGEMRNVAEFDPMQAVLVRYPFGVPVTVLKEIAEDLELIVICRNIDEENEVLNTFENYSVKTENCSFLYAPTNSWWVRDYGPWFVFDGNGKPGIVDFPYNRPRPRDNDIPAAVAEYLNIDLYGMNIFHTGGNYMTDGLGKSSSTDLIVEENPAMTEEDINNKLRDYLAIQDYYVLEDPLDDYIKHIDCWGKFLTHNKVIIGQVAESDYRYQDYEDVADFFSNTSSSYGVPYEVYRVFTPGNNQTTPYTNSLIVNNKVFVPITGSQYDDEALQVYEAALPGYEIIGIYYNGWYNTDALHCRAKGVADLGMLYIDHMPVLGEREYAPEMEFVADITAYSGMEVYPDSVYLNYTRNELQALYFELLTLEDDGLWHATISDLRPGDEIRYYIEANDASGRTTMHPFIGHHDPHEFRLKTVFPDIIVNPDTLVFDNYEKLKFGMESVITNQLPTHVVISGIDLPDNPDFSIGLADTPSFPYILEANENMSFSIYFKEPLPEMGIYLTDTLVVKTEYFEYPVIFQIDRTGVNTFEPSNQTKLKVYPNPASYELRIEIESDETGRFGFMILNTLGQSVYQQNFSVSIGKNDFIWNLSDQSGNKIQPGTYYYLLSGDLSEHSGKFIVE